MPKDPTVMRALGLLAGDLWSGITGRPRTTSKKQVLRHDVEEETRDTPQGKAVIRRTTIEEIEIQPPAPPAPPKNDPPR